MLAARFHERFIWALLGCIAIGLLGCSDNQREAPKAVDGVIDLTDWDFTRDGPVSLEGEWHLWWNQLLSPSDLQANSKSQPHVFSIPGRTKGAPNPDNHGKAYEHFGYATFALKIKLPTNMEQALGVDFTYNSAGNRLDITGTHAPAKFVYLGKPGKSSDASVPSRRNRVIDVPVHHQDELYLTLQSSNYHFSGVGLWAPMRLGHYESLRTSNDKNLIVNYIALGIILVMAIYHLLLFATRSNDHASLWLGIFCLHVAIRQFLSEKILDTVYPASHLLFKTTVTIEYLTICFTIPVLLFFKHLIRAAWFDRLQMPLIGISLVASLVTIVTPTYHYDSLLPFLQAILVLTVVVVLIHLLKAAQRKHREASTTILAAVFMISCIGWDIYAANNLPDQFYMAPFGMVTFILAHSYLLAYRFAQAHTTAKYLTRHLQREVEKQTQELWDANQSLIESHAKEIESTKKTLIQTEKLSKLGQLIASIGHEMASPIMLMTMTSDLNKQTLDRFEKGLMSLFQGSQEAERAGAAFQEMFNELRDCNEKSKIATQRLKDVSIALRTQSRDDTSASPQDLTAIIRECIIIVQGRLKVLDIEEILEDMPHVSCYRSRIGQVVTNLLANAADALHEKRAHSIANEEPKFRGKVIIRNQKAVRNERPGVLVTIEDNGDGVPDELKTKIFDEFFTTKPAGQGTGLGLSMCAEIVRDHSGILTISDSTRLGGACFELWLPIEPIRPTSAPA